MANMTASEKRTKVISWYKLILGRNYYSQDADKRECVFTPYKDGKYYSDCSSSIRRAYRAADIGLNNIGGNTVGMYQSKLGTEVNCRITDGVPMDISALRVGDILLFAGTDSSRKYAEYVGHVEMVYSIDGDEVTLCGHGSGRPSLKDMHTYCRSRQNAKTSTARGNKGLICVKRFIQDDEEDEEMIEELKNEIAALKDKNAKQDEIINTMGAEIADLKAKASGGMIYNYIDDNMPEWAREAVQWFCDKGIIVGDGTGLGLDDTKLWLCVVIYRAVKFMAKLVNVKI